MWTLRGWLETDKDGNEIMVAEEIPKEKPKQVEKHKDDQKGHTDEQPSEDDNEQNENENDNVNEIPKDYSDLIAQEAVRRVYDRACYRHCPTKALIKMKYGNKLLCGLTKFLVFSFRKRKLN